jgi:thiosulfate/3-mercaptopyruvate sulfurtransferase
MPHYPLIIEPSDLEKQLHDENLLIVDLCKRDIYPQYHIPGSIHLDYAKIIRVNKPVMGAVPKADELSAIFSALGISTQTHVVAYDDEGGGKAGRFLWTLELAAHHKLSLLNGGLFSWANEGHPLSQEETQPQPAEFDFHYNDSVLATQNYLQQHLDDDNIQLLDARSLAEYNGHKAFSNKAGHIPGAIHYEWTDAMDKAKNLRMLPIEEIQKTLTEKGFNKDQSIVVYCHSHHRSAYSYYVLRAAGFKQIKGYPGSWSEWGNLPNTPIEV